ncbi:hypothetical protein P43SY_002494 [Pythium insidiosum]|uniref:Uncharacterized protein n=1 Tax=Pythium insidiosum TaxID=114742 RepID=A0AAD5LTW8_PYTIN|nr:hypothetical protein P43SY_002494 [Pythium insidiosum]
MDTAVQVLQTIWDVYNEVQDGQSELGDVTRRLDDLLQQFRKMKANDTLVQNELLDKYVAIARRFLRVLKKYQKSGFVKRVFRQRAMLGEVETFNKELEALFQLYHLAVGAHVVEHDRSQEQQMEELMKGMRQLLEQQRSHDATPQLLTKASAEDTDGPTARLAVEDIAAVLVSAQVSADEAEQRQAAETLWALSEDNAHHEELLESGAAAFFVEQLASSSLEVRQCAARALRHVAAAEGASDLLYGLGAIPSLIALLKNDDPSTRAVQAEAAAALSQLATNESQRTAIAKGGAIASLVDLVRLDRQSSAVRMHAAQALGQLASDSMVELQLAIAQADGIEPLVDLLRSGSTDECAAAVGALWNLSDCVAAKSRIARSIGDPAALVQQLGDSDASDEDRQRAASALTVLAHDDANDVAIGNAGGIEALVAVLRDGTAALKLLAAWALSELTDNEDNQRRLVAAHGVPVLLAAASSGADVKMEKALFSLARLADDAEFCAQIAGCARGVKVLVQALRSGSPMQRYHAATVLWGIAECEDFVDDVVSAGASEPLVALARDGDDADIQHAAGAMGAIARNGTDGSRAIVEAGGIAAMLEILQLTASTEAEYNALCVLQALADVDDDAGAEIVSAGGVALVAETLNGAVSADTKSLAATLLAQLLGYDGAMEAAEDADVVQLALDTCRSARRGDRSAALGLIKSLAEHSAETRETLRELHVDRLLAELIKRDADALEQATAALALAWVVYEDDEDALERAVKSGVLSQLANLLESQENDDVAQVALDAVTAFAEYEFCGPPILKAGLVPLVIEELRTSSGARRLSALAVMRVLVEDDDCRAALVGLTEKTLRAIAATGDEKDERKIARETLARMRELLDDAQAEPEP